MDALWPTGWYPDDVLQYIYLDIDTTSKQTYDLDNHGQVYTASLEGGYPFEVGEGLYVEPQLQATYTRLDLRDSRDSTVSIRFDDRESLVPHVGVRLARGRLAPAAASAAMQTHDDHDYIRNTGIRWSLRKSVCRV